MENYPHNFIANSKDAKYPTICSKCGLGLDKYTTPVVTVDYKIIRKIPPCPYKTETLQTVDLRPIEDFWLEWYKKRLQAIVDTEEKKKKEIITENPTTKSEFLEEGQILGYNQAKQDTIDYLNNEIKSLQD